MQRDWIEIKAVGPREQKDAAIWLLVDAGSPGVVEADDGGELPFAVSHSALGVDAPEPASVNAAFTAYLPVGSSPQLAGLEAKLKKFGWSMASTPYAHGDWTERWKRSIRPVRITTSSRSIVIKPTWRTVKKRPGDIIIAMDPGMAFGTGSHATTKTCIKALLMLVGKKLVRPRKSSFLDVGTGTGILAIAAIKLGMAKAVGTDIDPDAVRVARENTKLNRTAVALTTKPLDVVKGRYECVAANILAGDLHRLAPALMQKTAIGGYLILSGLLVHEAAALLEAYAALGFKKVKTYTSGEWSTLVLVKRASV